MIIHQHLLCGQGGDFLCDIFWAKNWNMCFTGISWCCSKRNILNWKLKSLFSIMSGISCVDPVEICDIFIIWSKKLKSVFRDNVRHLLLWIRPKWSLLWIRPGLLQTLSLIPLWPVQPTLLTYFFAKKRKGWDPNKWHEDMKYKLSKIPKTIF